MGVNKTGRVEHLSHTATVGENSSTDFRTIERILLVLCIACCGLLVLKKTNVIQGIRQKLRRSSERNIAYQREEHGSHGSQDLSFIYSGVTTL